MACHDQSYGHGRVCEIHFVRALAAARLIVGCAALTVAMPPSIFSATALLGDHLARVRSHSHSHRLDGPQPRHAQAVDRSLVLESRLPSTPQLGLPEAEL